MGEILAYVTAVTPTIEVVPFHLRVYYMLCVFLLPAFTRRDMNVLPGCFKSVRLNACAYRLDLGLYSSPNEFFFFFWGGGEGGEWSENLCEL